MSDGIITVGWDIGGAHLKIAALDCHSNIVFAQQYATPIWQGLESLLSSIDDVMHKLEQSSSLQKQHAITMTAELVDYFSDRDEGIKTIIDVVQNRLAGQRIVFYAGASGFVSLAETSNNLATLGSANWHATASFIAQNIDHGIMIDMGTTTTDIIPFTQRKICTTSVSDHDRLCNDELVYTGLIRTPLMAITHSVIYLEKKCALMAENFATMADVYRIAGKLNECYDLYPAADNRSKTIVNSIQRLMRMLGVDDAEHIQKNQNEIIKLSYRLIEKQMSMISNAVKTTMTRLAIKNDIHLVLTGCGANVLQEFLSIDNTVFISLEDLLPHPKRDIPFIDNCQSAISVAALFINQHEA